MACNFFVQGTLIWHILAALHVWGVLCYRLTDVPPQPNSPPDYVFRVISPEINPRLNSKKKYKSPCISRLRYPNLAFTSAPGRYSLYNGALLVYLA